MLATAALIGCGEDCATRTSLHLDQKVLISICSGATAVAACSDAGGYGGADRVGDSVSATSLSAASVICIAASNGMQPGLSQYHAIWDPNRNDSKDWWVQMIREERCYADHAEGRGDLWHIDGISGSILSQGHESYTAVSCQYGRQ